MTLKLYPQNDSRLYTRKDVIVKHMQTAGGPSAKAAESPLPTGRLLTYNDIVPSLKGRQAELVSHTVIVHDSRSACYVQWQSHVVKGGLLLLYSVTITAQPVD